MPLPTSALRQIQFEIPLRKWGPTTRVTASGKRRHSAEAIRSSRRSRGGLAPARK